MGILGNPKYVIVNGCLIVFSPAMKHSEFKNMSPTSAGFISFSVDEDGNPSCSCYGKSESLDLESNTIEDTKKAKFQLLNL